MRTRNSGNPKPAPPPKKTPPSRRSAGRTPPNLPPETDVTPSPDVEQANPSAVDVEVTPETKATRGGKTRSSTRKAAARTKTPTSTRAASRRTPKSGVTEESKVEETPEKDEGVDHIDEETVQKEETIVNVAEETRKEAESQREEIGDHIDGVSAKKEETSEIIAEESVAEVEPAIVNVEVTDTDMEGLQVVLNVEEPPEVEEKTGDVEQSLVTDVEKTSGREEDSLGTEKEESANDPEPEEDREEVPEEDDRTIDPQQEEKATGTEESLDQSVMDVEEPSKVEEKALEKEEPIETVEDAIDTEQLLDQNVIDVEEPSKFEEKTPEKEENLVQGVKNLEEPLKTVEATIISEQPVVSNDVEATSQGESQELGMGKDEGMVKEELDEEMKTDDVEATSHEESEEVGIGKDEWMVKEDMDEEMKTLGDKVGPNNEPINMEEDFMEGDVIQVSKETDAQVCNESPKRDKLEESGGKEIIEELKKDKVDVQEHVEATDAFEVERAELNAAAKKRKLRKELEIFVGGLDHDATEEDLKKAFENIGEVVEVRLLKNKGCAFVEFATKEQASQTLLEMKNPLIRGKRCRTAPSEDNDMLFLGNICNTWTKEAIKEKLKDYGIQSVENINVIPDARHEGLSRGFAFLEFSCHADAMQAYKRLQKPDAIFGHAERTAKVAFAEPIHEPDPEVMAQVKTVFVDGLPPQWTEDKVREKLKGYGEIVRITLSRNMSTAKRRDYGFVDFSTHEAAVACIEGINSKDFGEGNSKGKVRARLSNPLPKSQPVKGGMCGGFRIGRGGGAASSSRSASGFGLGGHAFNRQSVQRDRGFYHRGRGQTGRVGFTREHDVHMQYPPFQRREMFGRGAWRDHFGAPHDPFAGGPTPLRPPLDMMRHDIAADRGRGRHTANSRLPFPNEERYSGPVMGRQMDDPYFYDGPTHGIKRPFSVTDQEPDYVERSRLRPRMDFSDPAIPYRASGYRGAFGPDGNLHSHDYCGPDYRDGPRPAFYGSNRPYGGGYPPRY